MAIFHDVSAAQLRIAKEQEARKNELYEVKMNNVLRSTNGPTNLEIESAIWGARTGKGLIDQILDDPATLEGTQKRFGHNFFGSDNPQVTFDKRADEIESGRYSPTLAPLELQPSTKGPVLSEAQKREIRQAAMDRVQSAAKRGFTGGF